MAFLSFKKAKLSCFSIYQLECLLTYSSTSVVSHITCFFNFKKLENIWNQRNDYHSCISIFPKFPNPRLRFDSHAQCTPFAENQSVLSKKKNCTRDDDTRTPLLPKTGEYDVTLTSFTTDQSKPWKKILWSGHMKLMNEGICKVWVAISISLFWGMGCPHHPTGRGLSM